MIHSAYPLNANSIFLMKLLVYLIMKQILEHVKSVIVDAVLNVPSVVDISNVNDMIM